MWGGRLIGWIAAFALVVIAALAQASGARAATNWVVTNNGDGAPTCPSASQCTLRGAVSAASSSDTITVPAGIYTLTGPSIPISGKNLQIAGPSGAAATTVTRTGAGGLFAITGDSTISFSGLTLTNADNTSNGAISIDGSHVSLANMIVSGNHPPAGSGGEGAVQVGGANPTTLSVTGSTFSLNRAGS